ncbi:MAG: YesL family protein [Lachnospiraceae bacterium]|nr:YesL family protein [Lachnospiraceae bacterium]
MGIFNLDSKFMRALSKLADLMWVNILTMVCCIPIFTIGASFTAMHTVVYKLYKNEEGYITREFFKAFKSNFKQSTLMWLIYLVLGLVLCGDIWLMYKEYVDLATFFKVIIGVAVVVYLFSLAWVFVLQSRYENPIKYTLKNTLVISLSHVMYTLMMIILFLLPVVLLLLFSWAVPVCFLLGFSVPAFVQSILYAQVFDKIEHPQTDEEGGEETEAGKLPGSGEEDEPADKTAREELPGADQPQITEE